MAEVARACAGGGRDPGALTAEVCAPVDNFRQADDDFGKRLEVADQVLCG